MHSFLALSRAALGLLACATLCFLLPACGKEEATEPEQFESTLPEPPQQEAKPARIPSTLAMQAAKARGAGFHIEAPSNRTEALAHHFQVRGTARFVPHNPASKPSLQGLDIALAGPELQRYSLSSGEFTNRFLLGGSGDAWVKTPNDTQPRPFSSEANILEEDATLRWFILRFPRALRDRPIEQERQWSKTWEAGGLVLLKQDQDRGQLLVRFDANGLPTQVYRALEEGDAEPELLLEVSNWTVSVDHGSGERLYPRDWVWHREDWKVEEVIDELEDRALYLDVAFRPKDAPLSSFQVRRSESGAQRIPRDRFALVQPDLHYQLLDSEQPPADPDGVLWQLWDGESARYALQVDPESAADLPSFASQLCLLWSSSQSNKAEVALQRLSEAAAENGLEVEGPLWLNTTVDGLEALLPVRRLD